MARKQNTSRDTVHRKLDLSKQAGFNGTAVINWEPTSTISETASREGENVDLDAVNLSSCEMSVRPKFDPQVSILSTDSGFLPKDIQHSSFVDDVIEELNSKGISHSDIICCQDCHSSYKEIQAVPQLCAKPSSFCRHKSKMADHEGGPAKKKSAIVSANATGAGNSRRLRNNEASRRSRASRKNSTLVKEEEIARLEEENQRLTILLNDFHSIATSSKQWIVQKMENPESVN